MAHALPLTKLAGLLMKTLAKPLSKRIKHDFSRFYLTQRLLVGVGQASHQVTSRMTIWSSGYQVRSITPLEEQKALKTGAEFVGESVVLLVSGGVIVWEYNRSNRSSKAKEATKREKEKREKEALEARLLTIEERLKDLDEALRNQSLATTSNQAVVVQPQTSISWGWLGSWSNERT